MDNQKYLSDFWEHAATHTPPHHLHRLSTNAQRSWTTLIWGIILYEIDGWGQPLTERVKTTLRCPLWISMMENRLLKKIYVCSPLPQESTTLSCSRPPQLWPIKHVIVVRLNSGSIQMPSLRQLAHCHANRRSTFFWRHTIFLNVLITYDRCKNLM